MVRFFTKSFAVLGVLSFVNLACFSSYRVSINELEKLQTGYEAEEVSVIIDHCEEGRVDSRPIQVAQAETDAQPMGADVESGGSGTGCPRIYVSSTSPIAVITNEGVSHRITPFNFTLSDTQLVSPDYDLLLPRADLADAEVDVFSTGKTIGLIAGITAVAVGSFLLISLLAPPERGLGGN